MLIDTKSLIVLREQQRGWVVLLALSVSLRASRGFSVELIKFWLNWFPVVDFYNDS